MKAFLIFLLLLPLVACSGEPADEGAQADRDVSGFLPGHGPEAPDVAPPAKASGGAVAKPASPAAVPHAAVPHAAVPKAGGSIRGVLRLAPGATPPPRGTLYIIAKMAKNAKAPPMAVQRINAPTFPLNYTLSAADAMIPGMPFAGKVNVTVRLDTDGNASTREPTDLAGSYAENPAQVGQTDVDIELRTP
ncbi:MAG: hypothetical protein ACE5FC_00720 [Myxococcota bacterium]